MKLTLLLFFLSIAISYSQTYHLVKFSDKNGNGYDISNPSAFLTQRAIDRRNRQGIAIDNKDLPITQDYINQVRAKGATILNRSRWYNSVTVLVNDSAVLDSIATLSFVSGIGDIEKRKSLFETEDKWGETFSKSTSNITLKSTSALNYGGSFDQINIMNGIPLHEAGYMGQGIEIAVFDAGFTGVDQLTAFDSLFANNQILETYDFVNDDTTVYELNGHGMMVLSVMGGYLEGELIGTAPKANYRLYITEDVSAEYLVEEDNWIAAAERADSLGVDIINSSLGYTEMDNPNESHEYADMTGDVLRISQAADIASAKGILVVNSAGNSGSGSWYYIGAPADGDSVMTIGAVNTSGIIADFSSRGPSADGDLKPNVSGVGEGATLASASGGVWTGNGTSFSSPIIAGMTACLWQCLYDEATNMDIKQAVEESAHMYNNPDNNYGYGIPNYQLAHNLLTGTSLSSDYDIQYEVGPNPFTNSLQFVFTPLNSEKITINMYDVAGKLMTQFEKQVKEFETVKFKMEVPETISNGVYFIQIKGTYSSKVFRVVKQ